MDWKTLVGFTLIFHALVYFWRKEWVLRLETRKLNSTLNGIGQSPSRKYFRAWFGIGTYATIIIGFPFTLFLFLRTIFYTLFPSIVAVAMAVTPSSLLAGVDEPLELHHEQLSPYPDADMVGEEPGSSGSSSATSYAPTYLSIQPILPGWNLPLSHLPYYILAILISVVIHELGHAIASASHKIPILSVGVSLFGPLIPAAHVELNSTQLKETTLKKQLDILTAGVWMNMYLALITYFIVPKLLPAVLWPTHSMGNGLSVTEVWPNYGIGGYGGLEEGDIITGIESCPVKDLDSWYTCLENIWEADPVGYCISNDTMIKFLNDSEDCCKNEDDSATHLCFVQMDSESPAPPPPPNPVLSNSNASSKDDVNSNPDLPPPSDPERSLKEMLNRTAHCLPAAPIVSELQVSHEERDEVESLSQGRCHSPLYACNKQDEKPHTCLLSRLVHKVKRFRIVRIHRREDEPRESVLFVGNVINLYNGLRTTEYVPRSWFLSQLFGFGVFSKLPEKLETVLLLTAGLSAGLAVVNMLPIYGLDGYHIVDALVRFMVGKRWEARKISRLVQVISWVALAVALLTVFCSMVQAM